MRNVIQQLLFGATLAGLCNPWLALFVGTIIGIIAGAWAQAQISQWLRKRRQRRILYRLDQEQRRDPELGRRVRELVDLDETDDQETGDDPKIVG